MSSDGVWLEDMLCGERLSGTEKLWRDINRICDEFYLLVKFTRFPLTADIPQYQIIICKYKKDKLYKVTEEVGMELDVVLKKVKKYLEKYKMDHKEYNLQKPGGGEMI